MARVNHTPRSENTLTLTVYKKIREMMINYEIVPGQRLIFTDLAKRLNVSRTPVNSALTMLAKEGFLDFVPHQGYTVHRVSREEAESLYEILRIISSGVVGRAIRLLTPESLGNLEERKRGCEQAVAEQANREQFLLDQEFHAYIIEMSGIKGLGAYYRDIYQQIYLRISLEGLRSNRARDVVNEHQMIFDAIKHRDVAMASQHLIAHLDTAKNYIFSRLFDTPTDS